MKQSDSAEVEPGLLAAVLSRIIPAGAGFPGGGEIAIGYVLRIIEQQRPLETRLPALLAAIDRAGRQEAAEGFAALSEAQQDAVLMQTEAANSEAFDALVVHTYSGYYSDPAVVRLLGLEARPPQPRGHLLEPLDERLLDQVRRRQPIYRVT